MEYKFEYLTIPLDCTTELALPYTIYDSDRYKLVLKQFNEQDLEKAFRLKFESGDQPGSYRPVFTDPYGHFGDDNIAFALHGMQLQLCAIPKNGSVDEVVRERLSIGLECALGFLDEYVSWVYDRFSTVASRGVYKSHRSARTVGTFSEQEVETMRSILAYEESEYLPQHKFDTLRALLNAARHQAGASDVACVLYFSILEAIFVDDNKELGYKLSMRLTKYKSENIAYAKQIARLYGKRGKVIHGSNKGNVFTQEEYRLIESLAKDAYVDILVNPEGFTERELDGRLLA
jgi:hypothetical protein